MSNKSNVETFLASARKHLGYTSDALGGSAFASTVGYNNKPWAGSFIDVVARSAGLHLPSFTYVPAGLAEFIRKGDISRSPRPGDIAIFNFASTTSDGFGMQHCGIVTDVRELRTNGRFLTIEGNTTGMTSHQEKDGVYLKIRYLTDVVLFCRPEEFQSSAARSGIQLLTKLVKKLTRRAPSSLELEAVQLAAQQQDTVRSKLVRPGTRNSHIELVQLALSQVTELQGAERGKWDGATAAAFANFQRNIGRVGSDANGTPDLVSLIRLSKDTGLFTINE